MEYKVNEGNMIGGQEPQSLTSVQERITASAVIVKGNLLEVTGDWTVGPAAADSTKVIGVAFNSAAVGDKVVVDTEGFVKLQASNSVITAGDDIGSAGSGNVKKWSAGSVIGKAYTGCAANGVVYLKLKQ